MIPFFLILQKKTVWCRVLFYGPRKCFLFLMVTLTILMNIVMYFFVDISKIRNNSFEIVMQKIVELLFWLTMIAGVIISTRLIPYSHHALLRCWKLIDSTPHHECCCYIAVLPKIYYLRSLTVIAYPEKKYAEFNADDMEYDSEGFSGYYLLKKEKVITMLQRRSIRWKLA